MPESWESLWTAAKEHAHTAQKWVLEAGEGVQRSYRNAMEGKGTDPLEEVQVARKSFLKEVPFKYRYYFLLGTTGLVFLSSPRVAPRIFRSLLVFGVGVFALTPELSPLSRRR